MKPRTRFEPGHLHWELRKQVLNRLATGDAVSREELRKLVVQKIDILPSSVYASLQQMVERGEISNVSRHLVRITDVGRAWLDIGRATHPYLLEVMDKMRRRGMSFQAMQGTYGYHFASRLRDEPEHFGAQGWFAYDGVRTRGMFRLTDQGQRVLEMAGPILGKTSQQQLPLEQEPLEPAPEPEPEPQVELETPAELEPPEPQRPARVAPTPEQAEVLAGEEALSHAISTIVSTLADRMVDRMMQRYGWTPGGSLIVQLRAELDLKERRIRELREQLAETEGKLQIARHTYQADPNPPPTSSSTAATPTLTLGYIDPAIRASGPTARLLQQAKRQGWRMTKTEGGHIKFQSPDGEHLIIHSGTSSDRRSWRNLKANLKQAGLTVD